MLASVEGFERSWRRPRRFALDLPPEKASTAGGPKRKSRTLSSGPQNPPLGPADPKCPRPSDRPASIKREAPSEHTHQAALPSSFRDSSPNNTGSRWPIPLSQRPSPPPQLATSRIPAPATTTDVLTCLHAQSTTKSYKSYRVSFNKIYTTPHVWNDFDRF